MECILTCNYLLMKALLRRESNTVPQGYGMYLRLKLSIVERSTGGSANTVTHWYGAYFGLLYIIISCWETPQGYGMYFRLYLFIYWKAPQGRVKNTVPQGYGMYFRLRLSLIERSTGGSVKYSSTRIWNVFQFTVFFSDRETLLRRESNTVPQGYGMYFSWL